MFNKEEPLPPSRNSKKFSIDAVLRAMEQGNSIELMKFSPEGANQQFRALVVLFRHRKKKVFNEEVCDFVDVEEDTSEDVDKKYDCVIQIINEDKIILGSFKGFVIFEGNGFVSFNAHNFGYENENVPHVDRLIAEAIYNFVYQGVFNVWYSSMSLTKGGENMYKHISNKPKIDARPNDTTYDGNPRWKISTKK